MIPGSANPLLLKSAAAAGAYQIERSLRFNSADSAYLSRTPAVAGNRRTWTWAGWVKLGTNFSTRRMIFGGGNTANSIPNTYAEITESNELGFDIFDGSSLVSRNRTSAVLRDPSAWYHICFAIDTSQATASNRIKIYINSIQQTAFSTATYPSQNYDTGVNSTQLQTIGRYPEASLATLYFDGYLAECYLIDGQQLTPSSFTEVSATTGQLIPKTYSGTYGTNGFQLKFADNSSNTASTLGKDTSGNSNNWTPNNFSVTQGSGNYAIGTFTINSGSSISSPLNAFDGSLSTGAFQNAIASGTNEHTWTPTSAITGITSLRIYILRSDASGAASDFQYRINGGSYVDSGIAQGGAGWVTPSPTPSTLSSILLRSIISNNSNGIAIAAVEVNNVILVDYRIGSGNDSLVDTPTSYGTDTGAGNEVRGNYCTLNPLKNPGGNPTSFSNGNLETTFAFGGANFPVPMGTFGVSSGKWYWEITPTSGASGSGGVGIGIGNSNLGPTGAGALGVTANGYGYYYSGNKYNNNSSSAYGASYTNNDVIGVALDCDNGTLAFYKNGASQGTAYTGLTSGPYFAAMGNSGDTTTCVCNFGQRAFAYTAPSGFKALCDTNLGAPLTAKPNTLFDAVKYDGNGGTQTISSLAFSPDLVWIKNRSGANSHGLFDTIRLATKQLNSNTTDAESTDVDKLTAFTSAGFTVGNSPGTNASSNAYVGWAWDAGTSTVSNPDGSITSQVRANVSAGFSVATLTTPGSGTFTVGHGLNVAPSLVICKARNAAFSWIVYHRSAGAGNYLVLNSTAASAASATVWQNTNPSSTIVYGDASNWGTADYVMYSFAPVVGYSSFGSYTGNGSSDGPFVFTGMRPRFLMIKRADASQDWIILDAARNAYNVCDAILYPNASYNELYAGLTDFLSNGFKHRFAGTTQNTNGGTYIYAAFAENPFQYARAR